MQFQITHCTTYTYSQPIRLHPHVVRLRPRSDASQTLQQFSLDVTPHPLGTSDVLDLEGNTIVQLWFAEVETTHLDIHVVSQVETLCTNPFNYQLDTWAVTLPIDYPAAIAAQLKPYLGGESLFPIGRDATVMQLALELYQATEGNSISFLTALNQRIYETCQYILRETGDPLPAGLTWQQKAGTCRDFAVLFMEACRCVGLAARFVSGYQQGDPDTTDFHLHAWAEAYLPGAGWRGYDPTHGLAVADGHVALAASSLPFQAAPVAGSFRPSQATSKIDYRLLIQAL
jgi:transglutaminase-like putative cysteine protease